MTTSSVGRVWLANRVADGTPCDRGVVVVQIAPNQYEPVRFDPKTLHILK